ncbi:MAG: methyltransferase domain-containing protein [Actinomycetota bacterium]|nr:methyltransferase domain-containing protein [Actinomycetota bacterium]
MEDDLLARRARSFGSVAARYAQHRPGYPDRAVVWALDSFPVNGRVLDLAAGTGKLTESVLRCGVPAAAVLAVEPDGEMRTQLSHLLPEVEVCAGTAEQIPAEDGVVDAVVVGQAFHWFDAARALGEIARVLRPGGTLAALGNAADESVGWVAELVLTAEAPRASGIVGCGFAELPGHPAFDNPERREFGWSWPRTIDSLLDTISTHSWAVTSPPDQRAASFAAIRRFLHAHPCTRDGSFQLPMCTQVARVTRRG